MRKVRVTASMKKEFAGLRDSKGNLRRGGVLRVPRILPCDEWEALASVQQDALIAASAEDRYKPEAVVTPEPNDAAIQREHERLYQEHRAKAAEGGLPLVRELERRVLRTTH